MAEVQKQLQFLHTNAVLPTHSTEKDIMNIGKKSAVSVDAARFNHTEPFTEQARELAIQTVAHCSSVITAYGKILSGEKHTARETLVLAESEGRDYFGDMRRKMADLIARRLAAAEYLVANGQRMRKIGEYRAAAKGAPGAPLSGNEFQEHDFAPTFGQAMAALVGEPGNVADIFLIEPSAKHAGFYFLSHISDCGARVDYLTLPIRSDFVEGWLQREGLADPAGGAWRAHPCAGVEKAGQSLHPALEAA